MTDKIRVGCVGMIFKDDKILLGIRGKEPGYGNIILPGGGVDLFERLEDTVKREMKEETGLDIDVEKQFGTYEIITKPNQHRVIIHWICHYKSGELKPDDDLLDAKFYSKEEIQQLNKEGKIVSLTKEVLTDLGWI